jgi:hypothetical protein
MYEKKNGPKYHPGIPPHHLLCQRSASASRHAEIVFADAPVGGPIRTPGLSEALAIYLL